MPTQVRVKIGSVDLSLSSEVISVGWDTAMVWQRDGNTPNFDFNPESDMLLYCKALPDSWDGEESTGWETLVAASTGCYDFDVEVERFCSGDWEAVWAGSFSSKDWKINYDKQRITVKPKQYTALKCLKENWTEEIKMFGVTPVITVKPYQFFYKTHTTQFAPISTVCPAAPTTTGYCLDEFLGTIDVGGFFVCNYIFHRFEKDGYCDGTTLFPPDDYNTWTLLSGGCPGTPRYWTCPEGARQPYEFRNGRMLSDVLDFLFSETGCGLTIVSDFFGINPDGTHPSNIAYDAALLYLQTLVIFQKSDVKRHDASNPSTFAVWNMKLQDLLEDLKTMFHLDWKLLPGDVLRIEHVSYFASDAGNDYTAEKYIRELEYDREKIQRLTRYQYRDTQCSDYFRGFPVEIYCGEGETDVRLRLFSCDVPYISDADNAEAVGDDGWVLMTTVDNAGTLYAVTDNRQLAWTKLHENFYMHEMAGAGKINDEDVTPLSIKKTRKQPAFVVNHCCADTFDPAQYITTALGQGDIDSAKWTIAKDLLTLEPKY